MAAMSDPESTPDDTDQTDLVDPIDCWPEFETADAAPTKRRRLTIAGIIVAAAIALDQATKHWALNALDDGRTIDILPTLEFDLAFNSGFSFSTGSGNGNLVGLLVIALCSFLVWQIWRDDTPGRGVLFSVVLGGALGNLVDRLFRGDDGFLSGEVVDFIDVTWYAVFNVADMFVVCGCLAFVVHELLMARAESRAEKEQADDHEASSSPETV